MVLNARQRFSMCGQGFGEHRLLSTRHQVTNRICCSLLSLNVLTLKQQHLSTRVVAACDSTTITQTRQNSSRTTEVFVCLLKASQAGEEKANVVLDSTLETFVACLLKVKTCSCELHQRTVDVLLAIFCQAKVLQQRRI